MISLDPNLIRRERSMGLREVIWVGHYINLTPVRSKNFTTFNSDEDHRARTLLIFPPEMWNFDHQNLDIQHSITACHQLDSDLD
jgi:hypothetical protein